jgi:hypothetical protein
MSDQAQSHGLFYDLRTTLMCNRLENVTAPLYDLERVGPDELAGGIGQGVNRVLIIGVATRRRE